MTLLLYNAEQYLIVIAIRQSALLSPYALANFCSMPDILSSMPDILSSMSSMMLEWCWHALWYTFSFLVFQRPRLDVGNTYAAISAVLTPEKVSVSE